MLQGSVQHKSKAPKLGKSSKPSQLSKRYVGSRPKRAIVSRVSPIATTTSTSLFTSPVRSAAFTHTVLRQTPSPLFHQRRLFNDQSTKFLLQIDSSADSPRYLQSLYDLAANDSYLEILQKHATKEITTSTQHSIKTALQADLETIDPILVQEEQIPITLGRGRDHFHGAHFRYILPVTAVQSLVQFTYFDARWPDATQRFLGDRYTEVLACAKLCRHFTNEFSQLPEETPYRNISLDKSSKQGVKFVGPPGTGNTELLSLSTLFAAKQKIPIVISRAYCDKFGTMSIDFKTNTAKLTFHSVSSLPSSPFSYPDELCKSLKQHYLPDQQQIVIIDPMEPIQPHHSSEILDQFNDVYNHLSSNCPNYTIFAAHSSAEFERYKDPQPPIHRFPFLHFTNTQLSHKSLISLFTKQIQIQSKNTAKLEDISSYLEFIQFFTVPSIRSYHFLLGADRIHFETLFQDELENLFASKSRMSAALERFGKKQKVLTQLQLTVERFPFLSQSVYVHINTDHESHYPAVTHVVSNFFQVAIPEPNQIIHHRRIEENIRHKEIERNVIWSVASILGAKWEDQDGETPITSCIELHDKWEDQDGETPITSCIELHDTFNKSMENSMIITNSLKYQLKYDKKPFKTILASQDFLSKLENYGKEYSTPGTLIRFPSCHLFDFLLIRQTEAGNPYCFFISVQTDIKGSRLPGADVDLYDQCAKAFAHQFTLGYNNKKNQGNQKEMKYKWMVGLATSGWKKEHSKIRTYSTPVVLLGFHFENFRNWLRDIKFPNENNKEEEDM